MFAQSSSTTADSKDTTLTGCFAKNKARRLLADRSERLESGRRCEHDGAEGFEHDRRQREHDDGNRNERTR
jgi:hypothetical protein